MDDETLCIEGYGDDHNARELNRDDKSVHWQCVRCGAEGFEAIEDWDQD